MWNQQEESQSGSLLSRLKRSGAAICLLLIPFLPVSASAASILGNAQSFAVLGGSRVTNTGSSIVNGNLGIWPDTAITGFPPGIVNGTTHATDAMAFAAQNDLTTAYTVLAGS